MNPYSSILQKLEAFKAIISPDSISPVLLGSLLDDIVICIQQVEHICDTAERQRVADENARVENESTRTGSEQTRISNEAERSRLEQLRKEAEALRIENENSRSQAETERIASEADRVAAEHILIRNIIGVFIIRVGIIHRLTQCNTVTVTPVVHRKDIRYQLMSEIKPLFCALINILPVFPRLLSKQLNGS